MAKFGEASTVPKPPFHCILTFNIAGLTNEYNGVAHFIRDGKRVQVQGVRVSPREVLHVLLDLKIRTKPGEPDLVIIRIKALGKKRGRPTQAQLDLSDRFDEGTGFTAMERMAGWDGSIKAIMNAQGLTPRGVHPAELAVPGPLYVAELRKRGFYLNETVSAV